MTVDILLSTYNGEKYLVEQIESILSQTYKDWRLLIRDDGSTDKTVKLLEQYENKYSEQIKIIRDENNNLGSTNSFLYLLSKTNADLIFFCDQDDVWKNNKLKYFIDEYKKLYGGDYVSCPYLCFSAVTVVDENLNLAKRMNELFNSTKGHNNTNIIWNVLENDVTGCAMMINRALRELSLSCASPNAIHHDWYISLLATICGAKNYLPEETIFYRQHENNVVGASKPSICRAVRDAIHKKRKYPYYAQVESVLRTGVQISNEILRNQLLAFSALGSRNKVYRIFWHIKNGFLRSGNLFIKIYQLAIC